MSITQLPTSNGLPTESQVRSKDFDLLGGELISQEWNGHPTDVLAKYEALKAQSILTGDPVKVSYANQQGRARVIAKFERTEVEPDESGAEITTVEELIGVDVVKDIRTASYFDNLDDSQVSWVTLCAEMKWTSDEIDANAAERGLSSSYEKSSWSELMQTLYFHLIHGQESYYETAFVLRQSKYGVKKSAIDASFTGVNTVVTAPTLSSDMDDLVSALPTGEWLYKPPEIEYLGNKRWRAAFEWQWAERWSVVYGGTFGAPPA